MAKITPRLTPPHPLEKDGFNPKAKIPFGVTTDHVRAAMQDFLDFLALIDRGLHAKQMGRFENMLMQANFSSMVGEMISAGIPKYCKTVVKNRYHNGHPDILPAGKYPNDSAQHAGKDGIEIKASRYLHGWQGHNAEDVWLIVFVFQSGREGPKVARAKRLNSCLQRERCCQNRTGCLLVGQKQAAAPLQLASRNRARQK